MKSKIIYTKHNHYFVSWLSRVRLKKFNEKIIFVSDATRNQCLSFVSDKQAITIKNGVNTDKWKIERIITEKRKDNAYLFCWDRWTQGLVFIDKMLGKR
ncbi:hypothetical protein B738_11685 [Photorhabdus temperata subsp. temperata M1021]|nr:hypothetical protein B738_11685 [Photorhabdus temperata subsp. temperata M1021]